MQIARVRASDPRSDAPSWLCAWAVACARDAFADGLRPTGVENRTGIAEKENRARASRAGLCSVQCVLVGGIMVALNGAKTPCTKRTMEA